MKVNPSIFREYDIRGIAGAKFDEKLVAEYEKWYGPFPGLTLDLDTCREIGRAYGTMIAREGGSQVVVGYENRPDADKLKASFIEGVRDAGVNVYDADNTITPFIYFITAHQKFDGGVNITGSHNVYFYNGFKMMRKDTMPLFGKDLQEMRKMIEDESYTLVPEDQRGKLNNLLNLYSIYKEYLLEHIKLGNRKLRVIVDTGNGTPGKFIVDLLESLGVEVVKGLYLEPDPFFPNHTPDPESPKNMVDLIKAVKEGKNIDLGIAFDADGDRVGFIDDKGEFVFADDVLMILSRDVLSRNPGKKVLFDVKSSGNLIPWIKQHGGEPLMHKTGHAPIKATMRLDEEVILGGEVSGHMYFAENYYRIDDSFWAAAQVLRILSNTGKMFSEILAELPKSVRSPEIKLPCTDEVKFGVIKGVIDQLREKYEISEIDGARVSFPDGSWGLVRASNTSPYLTIRVEGPTVESVLKVKNILADVLDPVAEIKDKLSRTEVASPTGTLGFV